MLNNEYINAILRIYPHCVHPYFYVKILNLRSKCKTYFMLLLNNLSISTLKMSPN